MVFQNYALYPHLTVFENIAFPLRLKGGISDQDLRKKVEQAAETLELTEHLERKPANLSGGQRQRVAMGRAIVREAEAFLFDEPLSNLDAKLRGQMRTEILRMQRRLGTTTVYVTHDQVEAMTLGDRVALLRKGELQQVGTPRELYEHPVNMFVAGFIGSPPMNFVPGAVEDGKLELPFVTMDLPADMRDRVGDREHVMTGIRPEAFSDASVDDRRGDGLSTFEAQVDVVEWLGNEQYAYIPYDTSGELEETLDELERDLDSERMRSQLVVALDPASEVDTGSPATLGFDPKVMHVFDVDSGENLTQSAEAPLNAPA
jgi:multiple sugar transport system ATP-binding protein